MDVFSASALGMIFIEVNLDDLLRGNVEKLKQAQEGVAAQLGNAAASVGGLSPSLQQQVVEAMQTHFPTAVQHMITAGHLAVQHRDKLAKIPQYLRLFGQGGMHMMSAGQIAACTTSAFIMVCHVVASYDNAAKLAEANIKLDELLKIHSREYKADLESTYNRLGELFLQCAHGQDVAMQLQDCSQRLDCLALIWLDEIMNELDPVKESTKGISTLSWTQKTMSCLCNGRIMPSMPINLPAGPIAVGLAIPYTVLYAGPTVLAGHVVYSSWINDIKTRLDKVDKLMRRMSIAVWLRHVISLHVPTMQLLYNKYSTRLQQISSKADRIKEALERSQEFVSVEERVIKRLQEMQALPQHMQDMLAPPQMLIAKQGWGSDKQYKVVLDLEAPSCWSLSADESANERERTVSDFY